MSQREGQNIFIKTFGGFDVFVDGKQVHFSSEKAKEMLAVLVDKRGSSVSLSQMAWLLYEQSPEQTAKNNLRVIYYRLKKILENNGIGGMLIKMRRSFAVDASSFICDVYEFVEGNPDYVPLFLGNYMSGYEWGQEVVPYLNNLYCQYCETPMNGLSDQVHETILSQRKKGGKRK